DGRVLAHTFLGSLVVADSQEHRMAQQTFLGPFEVADLDDEPRLDPHRLAIPGRAFGRRSLHYRRLEPSLQLAQHRTVESGAHRPGVAQRSIDEGPEVKRADRLTVVARALPADDDELGGMVRAHLLPCRR